MGKYLLSKANKGLEPAFICPNCGIKTAHQIYFLEEKSNHGTFGNTSTQIFRAHCLTCEKDSYILERNHTVEINRSEKQPADDLRSWSGHSAKQIFPTGASSTTYFVSLIASQRVVDPDIAFGVPQVNPDLNQRSQDLYNEAGSIMNKSPRAAAALLRLTLEVMLEEDFDLKSGSIYSRLGKLYKDGIPDEIDTALHFVRIVGNAADHPEPGKILLDGEDGEKTVRTLFEIINYIVSTQLSAKKKLRSLTSFFTDTDIQSIERLHDKNTPSN